MTRNNPINKVDPLGLLGWDTVFKFLAKRATVTALNKLLGDGMDEGANLEINKLLDNGQLDLKDLPPLPPGWQIDPDTGLLIPPTKPVLVCPK
jgi:hypothetical protein